MIDKIRMYLIKKLLKEDDGYVYLGLVGGSPVNFFYDEDLKEYVLGYRIGNFYYAQIRPYGLCGYKSRYLPWGETINGYAYGKEPEKVSFPEWIDGVITQLRRLPDEGGHR